MEKPKAVFLAFGTQGDVYPIAALAIALGKLKEHYSIAFITHATHEELRRPFISSGIRFYPISSPPVLAAKTTERWDQDDASDSSDWKKQIEEQHREECLKAADQVFGSDPIGVGDFIAINFFALEGWHLSELYRVPCVVAAPYVVPYSAPSSFERQFRMAHPLLFRRLQEASLEELGWDDVMHWMWPLFMDRWSEWRLKCLHLSACPLTDPVTELPVSHFWPRKPLLLYGFSREVVECPSYWSRSIHPCGFWFFPWEWECEVSGSEACANGLCLTDTPEQDIQRISKLFEFLNGTTEALKAPIFVGLSSIGRMGYLHNPEGMLKVLEAVLQAADRKAVLFTSSYEPLDNAIMELGSKRKGIPSILDKNSSSADHLGFLKEGVLLFDDRLFCFSGSVPYGQVFPKCSIALHHGGSGTTAAAISAGIPQIICPFVLDQFYWAERMAWLGVAPPPLARSLLIPERDASIEESVKALLHSIKEASAIAMRNAAADLGKKICAEDGVSIAVKVLGDEIPLQTRE